MADKIKYNSALKVQKGIEHPPSINPDILNGRGKKKTRRYSADEFVTGILTGNRTILSRAITLTESLLPKDYEKIQAVIEKCLPYSGRSVRIGITGVPGAGKSTFIESFGLYLTEHGRRLAVLAIDPSSEITGGSILGDKTRMEMLSIHPNAFIRPSPAAGTLGGVARKTRETIILCEAAGFDTILVETVGVGQSETSVNSMVDFFLLLMLAGAGDELQGIKRGIIEMADAIAITKADGSNRVAAESARISFQNALHMYPAPPSGWEPQVMVCSAIENTGIAELWNKIMEYTAFTKANGYWDERRKQQAVFRMNDTINDYLNNSFQNNEDVKRIKPKLQLMLEKGKITSYRAALYLIDKYLKR
ncbi:MAG: ATPase/protein kinase [Bacteroidetes bacterium RBG_13_43_22]|nr:MAG: ATPase/protein kinase [Bacteroidetes bacterium RBG_13_43_22]